MALLQPPTAWAAAAAMVLLTWLVWVAAVAMLALLYTVHSGHGCRHHLVHYSTVDSPAVATSLLAMDLQESAPTLRRLHVAAAADRGGGRSGASAGASEAAVPRCSSRVRRQPERFLTAAGQVFTSAAVNVHSLSVRDLAYSATRRHYSRRWTWCGCQRHGCEPGHTPCPPRVAQHCVSNPSG